MTNVLITGGAGFIGSRLALALVARGHSVTILDTLSPQVHGPDPDQSATYASVRDKVRFLHGSVTDRAALTEALRGQDKIVHLAAETGTGQSMYQIHHYTTVNIGGTSLLLDLLASERHDVERIVIASSRAIYGEGRYRCATHDIVYPLERRAEEMDNGDFAAKCPICGTTAELLPTDEASHIHPTSLYGITKQVQEQMVLTLAPTLGIEAVALRYQNVYGPGQSLANPYTGILSIFANLILQGKPIEIFEDGEESRDFVFIDDVVAATMLALDHEAAANEVFNVGTGQQTSVNDVVAALSDALGRSAASRISGRYRRGDIRHNFADLAHARSRLGFVPAFDFSRGIAEFCQWVQGVGPRDSAYEHSLDELSRHGLMKR
jgi:dTDP-L-rhamnose 4-epimerase